MKPLIAIVTCHRFKSRADACRATWVKDIQNFDYKFFLSQSDRDPSEDEVFLDVPDDYESLPHKVRAVYQWAVQQGYTQVLKCDDDALILPERLVPPKSSYEGRLNHSMEHIAPLGWCSGFAYWLANDSLRLAAQTPIENFTAEDLWVGNTMSKHGITCQNLPGFVFLSQAPRMRWDGMHGTMVATCEFPDDKMAVAYNYFRNPRPFGATMDRGNRTNPRLFMVRKGPTR